ncbi:pleckstrin (PH) domain-containing protein [Tieghemostelium lacteum]|uniref:Pleckstrin (PH) domain-containing protein n=1 Tax=Tieghemostelium lacteum TaxID=361077 RepID=A0A152A373_TIELA|nr:pleckstrin (PH) domain-containing protein [Tieghemostelium lacteum]|eukprot:KYR00698.1 pleckstrin (PH) domain-containing protein [Tieghemostelium lacteum]
MEEILGSLVKGWSTRKKYKQLILHKENRDKVAKEILETEQIYVRNLEIIVQNYLKPLKNINPPLLSANSIQIIFGHIEDLLTVNRVLLNAIQDRMSTWYVNKQIGDSFTKLAPYLKLYTQYCSSYDKSISRLKRKCDDSKDLTAYLKRITSETGFGLDLQSLLIMPIQRIPRYKLLLKSLIDYTPIESPDYPTIMDALEKVSQVANHINESIREKQNSEKILSIQRRFTGYVPPLLAPLRTFIKEGYLTKICRKEPKKRWFILFSDALLYGTKIETVGTMDPIYKFHRLLPLTNSKLNNLQDNEKSNKFKNSFQIIHTDKSFTVFADTEQEKAAWIKEIEQVLKFLGQNEGSVARMNKQYSSMKILKNTNGQGEEEQSQGSISAPVWIPDNDALECMICTAKFTTIRRRHHCRRCGNVVCGKCSDFNWKLDNQKKEVRVCKTCYISLSNGTGQATITSKPTGDGKSSPVEQSSSPNSSTITNGGISIDVDSSSDNDTDNETSSIGDSHSEIPTISALSTLIITGDTFELPPPPPPIAITTSSTSSTVIPPQTTPIPPPIATFTTPSSTNTTPSTPTTPPTPFTPPPLTKQGSQANSLLSFCNLVLNTSPNVSPSLERKNSTPKLSDLAKFNMPEHGKRSQNSSPISSPQIQRKNDTTQPLPTSPLSQSVPVTSSINTTEEKVILPEIKSILNNNTTPPTTPPPSQQQSPIIPPTKTKPNLPPTAMLPVTPKPPTTSSPTMSHSSPSIPIVVAKPIPSPQPFLSPPNNNSTTTTTNGIHSNIPLGSSLPTMPSIPKKPLPPPPPPKQPSSVKLPPTPPTTPPPSLQNEQSIENIQTPTIGAGGNNPPPPIPPKRKTIALPSNPPPPTPQPLPARVLPPTPPKRN